MNMETEWYCKGHEIHEKPLKYDWSGLDDIYLRSGFTRSVDDNGDEEIQIQNVDGLHRAIGTYLAKDKKALNGKEVRFLRKQMDLSQDDLALILGVTAQSVARWEKGETEIQGPAELLLRLVYLAEILPDKISPQELAAKLREADSPTKEQPVFQATNEGWQLAA